MKNTAELLDKYLPEESENEDMWVRVEKNPDGEGVVFLSGFNSDELRQKCKAAADREGITLDELFKRATLWHLDELEKQGKKPQAVPKVSYLPNPYDVVESAPTANNKVTHVAAMAIAAGGMNARKKVNSWRDNTVNGHPVFPYTQGRDELTVYLDPSEYNAAELWAKVHALDALTLDVYLAVLAFICDPRNKATYPHVGWFTVNPQQIADMKAFRRYGNDRRVLIGKIVEAIHTLSDLRTSFKIHWPGKGKREQGRMATESGCKLFHIGSVIYLDQGELFEHPEQFPKEEKDIVGVSLFIGKWGNYWLQDGERYYWVAAATRRLLELSCNTKGQVFAKKIGMLLLTIEGGTNSRNKTLEFTIAELLERIGELVSEEFRGKRQRDSLGFEENRDGQNWASRTEEYLQAGLSELLQMGLLVGYNFGSGYPCTGDRGNGWSERWLSTMVYLTTPEAAVKLKLDLPQVFPVDAVPERKPRIRGAGKIKKPLVRGQYLDAATVAAIYEAYKQRNWPQERLAKELKIARPTLSNVLNRREAPSLELATRIRAFLKIPVPELYPDN